MFDIIIDLNKYIEPKIIEDFNPIGAAKNIAGKVGKLAGGLGGIAGGNTTNIKDKTDVTKNFENNQKIDRSMMVESITKLVNNISSDVVQKNSAIAASSAGASNTLRVSGVKCPTLTISGLRQGAVADNTTSVKTSQINKSKISNDISTTIDKTIEKIGATDLGALQADNTKQLNDFMSAMPGYDPNKALDLASKCPDGKGSFISAGNKCNVDSSYELDASIKQALDLDESFKINDQDDISNDIKTKLDQANFASCQANATASNAIIINDIICKTKDIASRADKAASKNRGLEISDIEQQAVAKLYMTCVFDQQNVSEIANKITNKISKKYNQIYDAVQKKGAEKGQAWLDDKMNLVDTFAAAGIEKIMAAAGDLPPSTTPDVPPSTESDTTTDKSENITSDGTTNKDTSLPNNLPPVSNTPSIQFSQSAPKPNNSLVNQKTEKISEQPNSNDQVQSVPPIESKSLISNPYILYGGIGLIVIIIFLIIIMMFWGSTNNSNKSNNSEDSDE